MKKKTIREEVRESRDKLTLNLGAILNRTSVPVIVRPTNTSEYIRERGSRL